MSPTLLWIGGIFLFLVYFPHIGKQINGAHRWVSIFGISCQPSEFMKYVIPIFFIYYCKQYKNVIDWPAFCRLFGVIAFFIGLILFEPDNGTAAILFMQLLVLFFLAKINWKYWVIPLFCLFSVAASFALHMKHVPDRIRIYLHPELDILGKGHQPYQAKLATGSGGMFGKGFGASIQKFNYLPEAKSDYIAAIYAEEFGFIGMLFLILLYMVIALIGFYIALHAKDIEGFYLASIITFTICFQAFLNLGVVSNLLPSKGTNLPFFSQGGSSLFANTLALSLLLDIRRKSEQKKISSYTEYIRMKKKVIFAVGGTGGHMIPACNVALQLRHTCNLFFCGVDLVDHKDRLEFHNFPFYTLLGGSPFHKNAIRSLKNLVLLLVGTWQCWKIYRKEKPNLVIGFGSFHSFPALMAAFFYRIPIILFESNVQEGIVNQFFSKWSVLYTATFKEVNKSAQRKFQQVKLPICRPFGICQEDAREYFGLQRNRPTLLITGGSLGARAINQIISLILPTLRDKQIQIIHLVGRQENIVHLREQYEAMEIPIVLKPFEQKMYFAWEAADIAICRGGAATLSELIEFEVPAIVIPYRFSSRGHQVSNAKYFSEVVKGGLTHYEEENIDRILQKIQTLWENKRIYRTNLALYKRKQSLPPLYQVILQNLQIAIPFYLLGIAGIGMSALAQILLQRGHTVYGSDSRENEMTLRLQNQGAKITLQSNLSEITEGACIVYSSAIKKTYLQSLLARSSHSLVMHRSDLLDQFMKEKIPLLVTGTHGKTTTSAMLAHVLEEANISPSYVIGGIPTLTGIHGFLGTGDYFIGEADESDGSFLRTPAFGAIVTNVESDHIEYWKTEKKLQNGFDEFLRQTTRPDLLFLCNDDSYLANKNITAVRYGFSHSADYQIKNFTQQGTKSHFTISFQGKESSVTLPLIGKHNARNASAVFGLCIHLGISELQITSALQSFKGVSRRCEYKGHSREGSIIYDDYAHHPTEIYATLQAMKEAFPERRLIALFQPHRYSRLQSMISEFALSLAVADHLVITDVYSAGENKIEEISSADLMVAFKEKSDIPCTYITRDKVVSHVRSILNDKDILLTIGAGDITKIGADLIS